MKKVLVISYGGGHAQAVIPVIKTLKSMKNIEVVVLGINLAADIFHKNEIACKTLSDFMDEEILDIGLSYAKENHNFSAPMSFANSIAYYGFSMKDLIDQVGPSVAKLIENQFGRRLFYPIESMKNIMKQIKPDVLITTSMHRFEAASIRAAKELGIKSIKIEDLVGEINPPFPDKENIVELTAEENLILNEHLSKVYNYYLETEPDYYFVMNSFVKNNLLKKNVSEEKILITGQPSLYKYFNRKQYENYEINHENKPIYITFMSQPLPTITETLDLYCRIAERLPQYKFRIKLHPNENIKTHRNLLGEYKNIVTLVDDKNIENIIIESSLVGTISSTSGFEAVSLNKNLFYMNFTNERDFVPFDKMGLGVKISTVEEGVSIIQELIENEKSKLGDELLSNRLKFIEEQGNENKLADYLSTVIFGEEK